jgi:hypothetical protein
MRNHMIEETRLTLRAIMNNETMFKKACRLFDKHKSVSLIESGLRAVVKENTQLTEEFLDNVDFSAIVKEFREEN